MTSDSPPPPPSTPTGEIRGAIFAGWTFLFGLISYVNLFVVPERADIFNSINVDLGSLTLACLWLSDHWYVAVPAYLLGLWPILKGKLDNHPYAAQAVLSLASILACVLYYLALNDPLMRLLRGIKA